MTFSLRLTIQASVFLLMGFASLGNLFTNLSMFDEASDFDYDPTSYAFAFLACQRRSRCVCSSLQVLTPPPCVAGTYSRRLSARAPPSSTSSRRLHPSLPIRVLSPSSLLPPPSRTRHPFVLTTHLNTPRTAPLPPHLTPHLTPRATSQSANAELAGTIIFIAYLMWLRYFNVQRAKMSQEATTSAADYTVEVSSLEQLPSSYTEDDVSKLFARTVVDSWRFRRKQQYEASTLWQRRWSTLWRRWRNLPEEEEPPPKRQTRRGSTGRRGSVVPGVGGAALPGGGGAHDDPWWAELGQKAFKRDKLSERELACTRCLYPSLVNARGPMQCCNDAKRQWCAPTRLQDRRRRS